MTAPAPAPAPPPTEPPVALVTGANKGIGFETARLLAEAGYVVLLGARDPDRGAAAEGRLRASGLDVRHLPLDVSDEASATAAGGRIAVGTGRLDVLVNNAGITGADMAPPSGTSLATLRAVYETNVFGVVAVTNAMLPLLRRSPAGRIVNVSSEVGSITSMLDADGPLWPFTSIPYPSSKTALNMVTAMYAKELWATPIKVNAANPGYCATDLNGHQGFRTPEDGARSIVALALLDPDGPTGTFQGFLWPSAGQPPGEEHGVLPW